MTQIISTKEAAAINFEKSQNAVEINTERLRVAEISNAVFVESAKEVQQALHVKLSQLVSECLSAVFDDPYEFIIEIVAKRNTTEAKIRLRRDGHEIDPYSAGGGVLDVASLALRLSSLMIEDPNNRRILIMDEPFRCASHSIRGRIASMLDVLQKKFGCQFIIITHMEELVTEDAHVVDLRKM